MPLWLRRRLPRALAMRLHGHGLASSAKAAQLSRLVPTLASTAPCAADPSRGRRATRSIPRPPCSAASLPSSTAPKTRPVRGSASELRALVLPSRPTARLSGGLANRCSSRATTVLRNGTRREDAKTRASARHRTDAISCSTRCGTGKFHALALRRRATF